jgi:multidrug resistance efflux pump
VDAGAVRAVERLEELTSFERVLAPFGVITSRQIDVGSLVTADTSTGTPLFAIDRSDVLRVQVYGPQDSVFALKDGEQAQVTVPEMPNRSFDGKVARNANSLQPGTRTCSPRSPWTTHQGSRVPGSIAQSGSRSAASRRLS